MINQKLVTACLRVMRHGRKGNIIGIIIALLIFLLSCYEARSAFLEKKAEGWHWYEDRLKKKEDSKEPSRPDPTDPEAQLKTFKQEISKAKAKALMEPSYHNVRVYMLLQKEMMDKATHFASRWKEVLYTSPDLDYTIKHPVSQAARHVYLDLEKQKTEQAIHELSKTHGLFFFYSGACAYCHKFAPIVKSFSEKYGWQVLAISMDGSALPEFPEHQNDNGTAQNLGVQVLPSLLAVEPSTGQIIPLSFGMTTHDQIEDRIRTLILKGRP